VTGADEHLFAVGAKRKTARFPRGVAERLLRLALEQALLAKRRHRLHRFIAEELSLIEDALLAGGDATEFPRQMSWGWLMRHQAAWHELQYAQTLSVQQGVQWESALGEFTQGKYQVVPLTDAALLYAEGKLMRHCVFSYSDGCLAGDCRIFSVRQPGLKRPIATLELRRVKGRATAGSRPGLWRVGQVQGFAHTKPSKAVRQLAADVSRRYNKQSRQQTEEFTGKNLAIAA
jgi:hypothetical protein